MPRPRETPPPRRVNRPVGRPGAGEDGSADPIAEPAMGWYDRSGAAAAAPETAVEGTSVGLPELFDPPARAEPPQAPPPPAEDWSATAYPPVEDSPPAAYPPVDDPADDQPTAHPVAEPTAHPVAEPTGYPVAEPTAYPVAEPTGYPPVDEPAADPTAADQPVASPPAAEAAAGYPPPDAPTDYPVTDAPTAYPDAADAGPVDLDKGDPPPVIEPRTRVVHTVDKAPPIVSAIVVAVALLAVAIVGTLLRGTSAENTKPRAPAAAAVPTPRTVTPTRTVSPLVRGIIVRAQRGPVSLSAKLPTGQLLFSGVLPKGTYRRFAVPKLVILVGDAGSADVYVNGVRRPRLGPAGRAVQLVVTAQI